MASAVFYENQKSTDTLAELELGDGVIVKKGVIVATTAPNGIYGSKSSNDILIQGTLTAASTAIFLGAGPDSTTDTTVTLAKGADVWGFGSIGVYLYGNGNLVDNAGLIHGGSYGLMLNGNATARPTSVDNSGTIEGIRNIGLMNDHNTLDLVNSGTITGRFTSIMSTGATTIVNTGTLAGNVMLSDFADRIDTSKGTVKGTIHLWGGNDTASGSAASDTIYGDDGKDSIKGNGGNDKLYGEADNDKLDGGSGNDKLYGDSGNDKLDGGSGNDYLSGGSSVDTLIGGSGNDTLYGGSGKDVLTGGSDKDQFRFMDAPSASSVDTITDFKHGEDKIAFDDSDYRALGASVSSSEFLTRSSGHSATNGSQNLIYDKAHGELWYDSNGNASGGATLIAVLSSHPTNLAYTDFVIV